MPGEILVATIEGGGVPGIGRCSTSYKAHRTAPHNQELSSPKRSCYIDGRSVARPVNQSAGPHRSENPRRQHVMR